MYRSPGTAANACVQRTLYCVFGMLTFTLSTEGAAPPSPCRCHPTCCYSFNIYFTRAGSGHGDVITMLGASESFPHQHQRTYLRDHSPCALSALVVDEVVGGVALPCSKQLRADRHSLCVVSLGKLLVCGNKMRIMMQRVLLRTHYIIVLLSPLPLPPIHAICNLPVPCSSQPLAGARFGP